MKRLLPRLSIALLFLACPSLSPASIRGELLFNVYDTKTGRLSSSLPSEFSYELSGSFLQIRLVDPSLTPYRHQLLTWDGIDVYTSDYFLNGKSRVAYGQIEPGPMPTQAPRWGIVEALLLSLHLANSPDKCVTDGALRAEYIPELLTRRAKGRASALRTVVTRDTAGRVERVLFITEPLTNASDTSPYRTSFHIAELHLKDWSGTNPTAVTFRNNTHVKKESGELVTMPLSEYIFRGHEEPSSPINALTDLAWESDVTATIYDYRTKPKRGFYALSTGEQLPFRSSPSYAKLTSKIAMDTTIKETNKKRTILLYAGFAAFTAALGTYLVITKRKAKQ